MNSSSRLEAGMVEMEKDGRGRKGAKLGENLANALANQGTTGGGTDNLCTGLGREIDVQEASRPVAGAGGKHAYAPAEGEAVPSLMPAWLRSVQ